METGDTPKAKKNICAASVREIAEFVYRRGDLRSGLGGPGALAGAAGHRALQRLRPPGYVPEMFLTKAIETDCLVLTVSGRADGVFTACKPMAVEEIKTTFTSPLLIPCDNPVHWAQAQLYAAMLAEKTTSAEVEIHLTYLDLDSGQTRTFKRQRSKEALLQFWEDTLSVYVARLEKIAFRQQRRNRLLRELRFPHPGLRPGQAALAAAVQSVAERKARLFAEAPTGAGKTAAVLFGALKSMGEEDVSQVLFLTAKTAGRQAAEETLRIVREQGMSLSVLVLSSRKDRCLYPEAGCAPPACPLAKGHFDRIQIAVDALLDAPSMGETDIQRIAELHSVCPYMLAREAAPLADVVICDYNYIFDPRAMIPYLLEPRGVRRLVLIDEAHNLPERAREMFSAKLSIRRLGRVLGVKPKKVLFRKTLQRLFDALSDFAQSVQATPDRPRLVPELPDGLLVAAEDLLTALEAYLSREGGAVEKKQEREDDILLLYFEVLAFMRTLRRKEAGDALIVEYSREGDASVKIFATDPGPHLRRALDAVCLGAVFFSATLSPVDFFAALLGGDFDDPRIVQPSIFPARNRLIVVATHVSTRFADRSRFLSETAAIIERTVFEKRGNYLVFFPSFAYLQAAADVLRFPEDAVEVLVQKSQPTAAEKKNFVAELLRKRPRRTLVGLAVMGGMFGEAVDLPGDALIGALVVGPGLPMVCFEQELIRDHFQNTVGKGFEFAYVYPGMNKVRQAAGRVHRADTDRGVLVFVGRRFGESPYRELFPWPVEEARFCTSCEAVGRSIREFWERPKEKRKQNS